MNKCWVGQVEKTHELCIAKGVMRFNRLLGDYSEFEWFESRNGCQRNNSGGRSSE